MVHLHYSPYQFASGTEHVLPAKAQVAKLNRLTAKDKIMPKLISREEGHAIKALRSPNAFISPNHVDAMRTIHSVFGC